MNPAHAFECSHDIVIAAPPEAVFDYVTNPQSWPKWIAASHRIESPDRPAETGEMFSETWNIRSGDVALNWMVRAAIRPKLWIAQADTAFLGPIVVQYVFEISGNGTKFTRTVRNPARPKPPTPDQIVRVDEEAALALANIKRNIESSRQ